MSTELVRKMAEAVHYQLDIGQTTASVCAKVAEDHYAELVMVCKIILAHARDVGPLWHTGTTLDHLRAELADLEADK